MKHSVLFSVLIFFSISLTAQITYEPGYYINNLGDTIKGLIKNLDWKNNPESIQFKINSADEAQLLEISEVKEFAVGNEFPFRRYSVLWDETVNRFDEVYSNFKDLRPVGKTLFLRQLTNGNIKLYEYADRISRTFYISKNDSLPEMLVFKYYLEHESDFKANNKFQSQLYLILKCDCLKLSDFENLKYDSKSLTGILEKYWQCSGIKADSQRIVIKKVEKKYQFGISAGAQVTGLKVIKSIYYGGIDTVQFPIRILPVIALEAEYFMPFNRNSFSLNLRPEVNYYSGSAILAGAETSIKTYAANIPIQVRFSYFLRNDTRIFANVGFGVAFPFSGKLTGALKPYKANYNLYLNSGLGIQMGEHFLIGLDHAFRHDYLLGVSISDCIIVNSSTFYFTYLF